MTTETVARIGLQFDENAFYSTNRKTLTLL